MQDLCKRYSSDLNIPAAITREILEHLRQHALQKLVEREQFQKTGKAVLKIKASGLRDDKVVPHFYIFYRVFLILTITCNTVWVSINSSTARQLDSPTLLH